MGFGRKKKSGTDQQRGGIVDKYGYVSRGLYELVGGLIKTPTDQDLRQRTDMSGRDPLTMAFLDMIADELDSGALKQMNKSFDDRMIASKRKSRGEFIEMAKALAATTQIAPNMMNIPRPESYGDEEGDDE